MKRNYERCGNCGKYPFCEYTRSAKQGACGLFIPREKSTNDSLKKQKEERK